MEKWINIVILFPSLSPVIVRMCWEHHHPETKNGGNSNFNTSSLDTVYVQPSLIINRALYKAIRIDTGLESANPCSLVMVKECALRTV